jgi:hypothetical protein
MNSFAVCHGNERVRAQLLRTMLSRSSALFSIIVCLSFSSCREAPTHSHGHGHGEGEQSVQSLTLNDGKPWETDASLRAGMTTIRDQMQAAVKPIHAGTYSADDYKALADRVQTEVTTIMSKCKLPPAADAQLHIVLTQIVAGADLMKKDGDRKAGASKIIQALQSYGKYFDHPDWKPIEH